MPVSLTKCQQHHVCIKRKICLLVNYVTNLPKHNTFYLEAITLFQIISKFVKKKEKFSYLFSGRINFLLLCQCFQTCVICLDSLQPACKEMLLLCFASNDKNKHGFHLRNNRTQKQIEIVMCHFSMRHYGTIGSAWALYAEERGERSALRLTANLG